MGVNELREGAVTVVALIKAVVEPANHGFELRFVYEVRIVLVEQPAHGGDDELLGFLEVAFAFQFVQYFFRIPGGRFGDDRLVEFEFVASFDKVGVSRRFQSNANDVFAVLPDLLGDAYVITIAPENTKMGEMREIVEVFQYVQRHADVSPVLGVASPGIQLDEINGIVEKVFLIIGEFGPVSVGLVDTDIAIGGDKFHDGLYIYDAGFDAESFLGRLFVEVFYGDVNIVEIPVNGNFIFFRVIVHFE